MKRNWIAGVMGGVALLVACDGCGKLNSESSVTIASRWKYADPSGACTGADLYGDGSLGCTENIKLVIFSDGTSFVSINNQGDAGTTCAFSYYMPAGGSTEDQYCAGAAKFRFVIGTASSPPTF